MKTITFDKFDVGIDHRKLASTSEANRLRVLKNGYVTTGKTLRKRPGVTLDADFTALGETGTTGLVSGGGVLNTFVDGIAAAVTHSDGAYNNITLLQDGAVAQGSGVLKIHYGEMYGGYVYAAVEFQDSEVQHHWVVEGPFSADFSAAFMTPTTTPTEVVDTNCPKTKGVIKQDDRIFAVNDDVVNYIDPTNATGDAKDWTNDVSGAGYFLPTGLRAEGSSEALGLGEYQTYLAVFHVDSIQLWDLDIGTLDAYNRSVSGIGTRYPRSILGFAGDILFLSDSGFRSVVTQSYTDNIYDVDIGSAIDRLVKPDLTNALEPLAEHFPKHGQYWCMYPDGNVTRVWVYTFSRTMKVSAWSEYEFPFAVSDLTAHNGKIYMRSGEKVYVVDDTDGVWKDDATDIDFVAEWPYLDFKSPGSSKYIASMDIVLEGTVNVQFRYDPNDPSAITYPPITVTGDTRQQKSIPVEITAAMIAPVFTDSSNGDLQIDMIQFHYEDLGPI